MTGDIEPGKRGGKKPKKLSDEGICSIKQWIDEDCTLSLRKIRQKLEAEQVAQIVVSITAIGRAIEGFNYSFKRVHRQPEKRNALSNIQIRKEYVIQIMALPRQMSELNITYIDKVGMKVSMRASMGRSAVGKPAVVVVPQLRNRNISIACAMTRQGILHYEAKTTVINRISFKKILTELQEKMVEKGIHAAVMVGF